MRPGDRYFSEADALRRHGVARGTLREALRFLEMQGVITVRAGPGGGSMVGRPGWPNLASMLALLLQFDQAPLKHVLEARKVIEPGIAELAARNATPEEVQAMAADLDAIEANLGDFRRFAEFYHRFWCAFAASTHNSVLALLSPALRALINSTGFAPNEVYRTELLGACASCTRPLPPRTPRRRAASWPTSRTNSSIASRRATRASSTGSWPGRTWTPHLSNP